MFSGRFLRRLRKGSDGVRLRLPKSVKVLGKAPLGASVWDPKHAVMWQIEGYPFGLDLDPTNDGVLKEDIERAARSVFEVAWREFQQEPAASWSDEGDIPEEILHPSEPRTSDPAWSPVIEAERVAVASQSALKVIFRSAYRPGCETVIGNLLIPTGTGVFKIAATHHDDFTGMREALLTDRLLKERMPDFDNPDEFPLFTQAEIDGPKHDSLVPDHCLSCVRSALAWLTDSQKAGLEVVIPATSFPKGEHVAPRVQARITLPPRFVPSPEVLSGPYDDLDFYTRCSMPEIDIWLLDLWRHPDVRLSGQEDVRRPEEIAQQNAEGWADEGVTDIRIETRALAETGPVKQASSYIRYSVVTGPTHTLARWLAFADGRVYRIAAGGPLFVSRDELATCTDLVASSFRRLDLEHARIQARSLLRC